jgi:hypothetical protein
MDYDFFPYERSHSQHAHVHNQPKRVLFHMHPIPLCTDLASKQGHKEAWQQLNPHEKENESARSDAGVEDKK